MISVTIFVTTLFVYVTKIICILSSPSWICEKSFFLFEMTTLILGVVGSRLSLNVINIQKKHINYSLSAIDYDMFFVAYKATTIVLYQCFI